MTMLDTRMLAKMDTVLMMLDTRMLAKMDTDLIDDDVGYSYAGTVLMTMLDTRMLTKMDTVLMMMLDTRMLAQF